MRRCRTCRKMTVAVCASLGAILRCFNDDAMAGGEAGVTGFGLRLCRSKARPARVRSRREICRNVLKAARVRSKAGKDP